MFHTVIVLVAVYTLLKRPTNSIQIFIKIQFHWHDDLHTC